MILPYLFFIEIVINKFYLEPDVFWFRQIAVPIVCIWLLTLWIYYLGFQKLKIKAAFKVSIGSFIAIFGAIGTNYIVLRNPLDNIIGSNWINILCLLLIGIVSLGMGLIFGKKKQ